MAASSATSPAYTARPPAEWVSTGTEMPRVFWGNHLGRPPTAVDILRRYIYTVDRKTITRRAARCVALDGSWGLVER